MTRAPTRTNVSANAGAAAMSVALVWAGLVIGVSFIATPAKFLAPSLPLAVALDVGSHTFRVFSRVELVVGLVLAMLIWAARPGASWWKAAWCGPLLITLVEVLFLLPPLDLRLRQIIAGGSPAPSHLHLLYVVLEGAKLCWLLALGVTAALGREGSDAGASRHVEPIRTSRRTMA